MNREIKFRGKMVPEQVWIYGTLLRIPAPLVCLGKKEEDKYYIQFADPNYIPDWNMPYRMVQGQVDNNTIGQFTGLHDKNGKEIYEGDIVLLDCYYYEEPAFDGEFKVIYDDINGMWLLVDLENKDRGFAFGEIRSYYKAEVEVIGNIYDNPELLGGEDGI